MSSPIVEAKIRPNLVNSVVHVVAEAQAVALTIVGSTLQNGRKIGDKPSSPRPLDFKDTPFPHAAGPSRADLLQS